MNRNTSFWQRRILHALALFAILVAAFAAPAPAYAVVPTNDDFDTPVAITAAQATLTLSDTDFNESTVAADDPFVCDTVSQGLHTIWYTYTPAVAGLLALDTFGSGFDTVLAIWTGTRGALQPVACHDDLFEPPYLYESEIQTMLQPGVTYYIEVTQFVASTAPQGLSPVMDASATWMTLNLDFTPYYEFPSAKYDNKTTVFNYTGTWSTVSNLRHYLGTTHLSRKVGNTALVSFNGTHFKLYYQKAPSMGNLDVYVDDVKITTINQASMLTLFQQVYESPVFAYGDHVIRLVHVTKYVNVDAIELFFPPDDTPPGAISNLAAAANPTYGNVNLSWTSTGDDGITGRATSYLVRRSSSPINLANWDAATPITSGVPVPANPGLPEAMTVSGLAPGLTYFFAVRALDEQGNMGVVSNSPSAPAGFPSPVSVGTYDDKHGNWIYTGTWTMPVVSAAYAGSFHSSARIGNSAYFVFTGSQFVLIHGKSRYHGNLDIYVDDVFVFRLYQFSLVNLWKQRYTSPVFPDGQHTVKFVHATGSRVDVDAIEVLGTPVPDFDPPAAITDLAAAPGLANGTLNLTWTAPAEDGTAGTGTASAYLVRYSVTPIADETAWDAATPVASGVPVPSAPGQAESMNISGLAPGVLYYVAVRAQDGSGNLGGIASDSEYAKSTAAVGPGIYDNKATPPITYTSWSLLSYQSGAYLASVHVSSVTGKTASLVFTGTDFRLIYTRDGVYGNLEVWVDGVLYGTINQYSPTRLWMQSWRFSDFFAALPPGQHMVQFRHATGLRVNVDAIEVFP